MTDHKPTDRDMQIAEQIAGPHYECEDRWYSCPLSEEGCANEFQDKTMCDCGRDGRRDLIAQALADRDAEWREKFKAAQWARENIRKWWSFSGVDDQQHNHTWHSREDFIKEWDRREAAERARSIT